MKGWGRFEGEVRKGFEEAGRWAGRVRGKVGVELKAQGEKG